MDVQPQRCRNICVTQHFADAFNVNPIFDTARRVSVTVEKAREAGMKVLALTREGTNKLSEMADVAICAPTAPYSDRIQEIHIKVIHILIEALEAAVIYKDGTGER